ncbi:serine hydrolase [uncultured Corynebacterium sp.]|uniref:serine hydrolase domain-containing protein n=1 Tax=uncultured Corynebacterium sp. TaxID=159447 RepID=UPI0025E3E39B|nr:serine hydrolase domain-containing protein [uncultured Corynebacterium sp.]
MEMRSPPKPSAALLVMLLVLALAPPHLARAATGSDFADAAAELGVPGGAVAHIDDGVVTRTDAYGQDGDGNPVVATTSFLWGSVSKPVAAAVVKRLSDDGALDLDASAREYVDGAPDVPVRTLLDHTSGLEFGAQLLDVDRPDATATDVIVEANLDDGADAAGDGASGETGVHQYSSLGYMVLQAVVESATGGSYQDAVRATPGTENVGASAEACADVSRGHRFAGPFAWPMDTGYDGAGAAYGYVCGTIDDLATFAASQMDAANGIIDGLSEAQPTSTPGQLYGPGWRISLNDDEPPTVWHTGTVPGYFSAVYLDPESGDGAAVLLNASGYLREEELVELTSLAFDEATGRAADGGSSEGAGGSGGIGSLGGPAIIVPSALFGLALLVLVAGWIERRSIRPLAWIVGAVVVVAVVLIAAPMLMGVPMRYFWLWEPGVVVAAAAIPAAMLAAAAMSAMHPRREATPTDHGEGIDTAAPRSS